MIIYMLIMSTIGSLILVLIPLIGVLAAVYLMLRYFMKENAKQFEFLKNEQDLVRLKIAADRKAVSDKQLITHKLQAFERMVLFLERINPPNLITRNIVSGQKARELQTKLLQAVREEYEHNMSQQVFLSTTSWELIKRAKEEIISLINKSMTSDMVDKDAAMYARQILTMGFGHEEDPVERALQSIRKEMEDL